MAKKKRKIDQRKNGISPIASCLVRCAMSSHVIMGIPRYTTRRYYERYRERVYTTVRWAQRYEMTFSVFELCSLFYGYCFPFKSCNGYSNWMEFSWFFFFLLSLLELMRNGHRQLKVEVEPITHLLYFKLTVIFLLTVHDIYPRLIFYMTSLFHDLYYFYY